MCHQREMGATGMESSQDDEWQVSAVAVIGVPKPDRLQSVSRDDQRIAPASSCGSPQWSSPTWCNRKWLLPVCR